MERQAKCVYLQQKVFAVLSGSEMILTQHFDNVPIVEISAAVLRAEPNGTSDEAVHQAQDAHGHQEVHVRQNQHGRQQTRGDSVVCAAALTQVHQCSITSVHVLSSTSLIFFHFILCTLSLNFERPFCFCSPFPLILFLLIPFFEFQSFVSSSKLLRLSIFVTALVNLFVFSNSFVCYILKDHIFIFSFPLTYYKSFLSFLAHPCATLPPSTQALVLTPHILHSNHDQYRRCADGCAQPDAANDSPGAASCNQSLGCKRPADCQVSLQGDEGNV